MTASSPAITWLIPVKNAMPYLPETLESIRCQTYSNHEVLVWDNGSTDGTLEELQRWIPDRIPGRIVTGRPLSVGNSRAELVRMANTELCACVDGDDINLPHRLEKEVAFMLARPEVAAVGSQVIRIDETGAEHGQFCNLPREYDDIVHRLLHTWVMWQPAVMFRRSAVIEAGNYRDLRHEDYDLWLRLATRYKLANMGECLLKYRVHKNNLTYAIPAPEAERDVNRAYIEAAPTLFGCTPEEADMLRNKRLSFAAPVLWRIARHLSQKNGGTFRDRLVSRSFLEAAGQAVRRRDFATRLLISALRVSVR